MKGRLATLSCDSHRTLCNYGNQPESWKAQGSITRVAARCHLGGADAVEHGPWKTMEWLHLAHCVRDGVIWLGF